MSFEVSEREFVCIVGPSGAGKTTLLKCMSGLLAPSSGEVLLGGRPVTEPPEEMGFVFQDYSRSLLPWLSVRDNVALPLHHKRLERADLEDLVLRLHGEFSVTIVFVTHDIDEAVYLGQRVVVLTGAPSHVQEELEVDLPSPRDQVETKELPEFTRLRAHVYRSIRSRGELSASAT
jgi:NitT/TauT family transport system ATP-binding protein